MVSGLEPAAIGDIAFQAGVPVHELSPQEASLEEAFMELTRDDVEFHARQHTGRQRPDRRPPPCPWPRPQYNAGRAPEFSDTDAFGMDEDADPALDADHAGGYGVYRDRAFGAHHIGRRVQPGPLRRRRPAPPPHDHPVGLGPGPAGLRGPGRAGRHQRVLERPDRRDAAGYATTAPGAPGQSGRLRAPRLGAWAKS